MSRTGERIEQLILKTGDRKSAQMQQFCTVIQDCRIMKVKISPPCMASEPFIQSLLSPEFFDKNGIILHQGRNTIKLFESQNRKLVVKQYGHLSWINRIVYGTLRRSKAARACRHAALLRKRGIDTPREIAAVEIRRHGLLYQSYFISEYSTYKSLLPITKLDIQHPEVQNVLKALTSFLRKMHQSGILHLDLNISNILYQDNGNGEYLFQVIDTNRMKFRKRISLRKCIDNLRRLSCPMPTYLYILDQYASLIHIDSTAIQLHGTLQRLLFEMRQRTKRWIKSKSTSTVSSKIDFKQQIIS